MALAFATPALVVAPPQALRNLRFEKLLDDLPQPELRKGRTVSVGFQRVHQLLDLLARTLGRRYSRSQGDASSFSPAPTGVSRSCLPMRLHPPPISSNSRTSPSSSPPGAAESSTGPGFERWRPPALRQSPDGMAIRLLLELALDESRRHCREEAQFRTGDGVQFIDQQQFETCMNKHGWFRGED